MAVPFAGPVRRLLDSPWRLFAGDGATGSGASAGGRSAFRRPVYVLVAMGLVTAAGVVAPVLARFVPEAAATGPTVQFATGAGTVAFPRSWFLVVGFALLVPFLYCLFVTAVLTAGTHLLAGIAGLVRSGRPSIPARPTVDSLKGTIVGTGRSFARTYGLVAVGFAPQALATLVTAVALVAIGLLKADVGPGLVALTNAGHVTLIVDSVPEVTYLVTAVGVVCTLWSGYIWTHAASQGQRVSRWMALAVAGPLTLVFAYSIQVTADCGCSV